MKKIIIVILIMLLGNLIYQTFMADVPDYKESAGMLYWTIFTTIIFLLNGIIKLEVIK
tara:strand:+ start:541 stop:714 length:174 start_codon:yes stop_codon:yes gene_type:complete